MLCRVSYVCDDETHGQFTVSANTTANAMKMVDERLCSEGKLAAVMVVRRENMKCVVKIMRGADEEDTRL